MKARSLPAVAGLAVTFALQVFPHAKLREE
jgi:hypothetical protein